MTRRVDRHQLIIALLSGLTLTGNGPAKLILGGAGNDTMVGLVDPNLLFGDDEDRVIAGLSSFYSESTKVLDHTAIRHMDPDRPRLRRPDHQPEERR